MCRLVSINRVPKDAYFTDVIQGHGFASVFQKAEENDFQNPGQIVRA